MLLSGSLLVVGFSTGPVASRTGAFAVANKAAEPNCTICHQDAPLNGPNGSIEILDLPAEFTAGAQYPLRVRLSHSHLPEVVPRWGFQLQAVDAATGDSSGFFIYPPGLQIVKPTSPVSTFRFRRYLEHGADVHAGSDSASLHWGDPGPVEWTFDWVAPANANGNKVYFFAAGNATNGSFDQLGDNVYTTAESTTAAILVAVEPKPSALAGVTDLSPPFPNPMNKCGDLSFEIARAGRIDLSIYDVQGRKIRTIFSGWHNSGPGAAFWNGRRDDGIVAQNGIYFVRLMAPGLSKPISHKIVLQR